MSKCTSRLADKRKHIKLVSSVKYSKKSLYSMLLFWRYSKICNITPIQNWTIYPPHFSILQAVNKMHCLYANAVVQPSMRHYSCYMHWPQCMDSWLVRFLHTRQCVPPEIARQPFYSSQNIWSTHWLLHMSVHEMQQVTGFLASNFMKILGKKWKSSPDLQDSWMFIENC